MYMLGFFFRKEMGEHRQRIRSAFEMHEGNRDSLVLDLCANVRHGVHAALDTRDALV